MPGSRPDGIAPHRRPNPAETGTDQDSVARRNKSDCHVWDRISSTRGTICDGSMSKPAAKYFLRVSKRSLIKPFCARSSARRCARWRTRMLSFETIGGTSWPEASFVNPSVLRCARILRLRLASGENAGIRWAMDDLTMCSSRSRFHSCAKSGESRRLHLNPGRVSLL